MPPPTNNALFTASRPLTARKLFAKDQRDDVMQEADILMKTGANSAGSYQSALKVLCDGENEDTKSKYRLVAEERAAAVDIPRWVV